MKFSLLSFNTLGTPFLAPLIRLRYKKIAELINKNAPDIICLQEVFSYYHLFLLKKYLAYSFFVYKKSFWGPQGGLVIISKMPLEKMSYKNFSSHGSLKNLSFYSKIVQNGMLSCKIKNYPVIISTTHTVSDFEFDISPTNHLYQYVAEQVEQIGKETKKTDKTQNTHILTGDFNMKKGSKLYTNLLNETKFIDVFSKATFPTYYKERLDYKFKGKTSERIDFILLKDPKQQLRTKSPTHLFNEKFTLANKKSNYLSDHIGLKVEFDMV